MTTKLTPSYRGANDSNACNINRDESKPSRYPTASLAFDKQYNKDNKADNDYETGVCNKIVGEGARRGVVFRTQLQVILRSDNGYNHVSDTCQRTCGYHDPCERVRNIPRPRPCDILRPRPFYPYSTRWHAAPVLSVCPKVPTLSRSRRLGQSPGVPAALLKSETADRMDDCDKVRFRPY